MSKNGDKQVDKCTSVTNSLLPDSSSCSGSSGDCWTKISYSPYGGSGKRSDPVNHDGLSSLSSGSSSCHEEPLDGRFEIELLSSEPEDYDESGHLFHMDIMKNSLSDISLHSSTRRIGSGKPAKATQNLSFSRARVREIERHNQILLQRIMTSKPTLKTKPKSNATPINTVKWTIIAQFEDIHSKSNNSFQPVMNNSRITSAAVNRRKKQRQIEIDNQLLRKKLEKIERSRRTVW
ncbi:protein hemingway isoform X1 [Culex quinquefasciatus]|uniref:protein hemingway isoform X1 n=1 Tax=Culex quinquefasciatus TaxID=7176 RepID=UPI0018E35CA2|nr:protein hemingway isoform X1 [Culex quinquefasciatus]XP_038104194.1 protein hemingway isoform X1 [Culex quinquefasciatus]